MAHNHLPSTEHGHDHGDHPHTHDDHDHDHDHDNSHDHDGDHTHQDHAHHDHGHGHSHGHGHGHGHSHGLPETMGMAFAVGIGLNIIFVVVESVYGLLSNSMALLADAAHNLGDVLGLVLAWVASLLARRKPSRTHSYGFRRSTILAALSNAVLLLVTVGGVAWEAVGRLRVPHGHVEGKTVLIVAAIGVVINAISALMFLRGSKGDANIRGAFLHLAADVGVSFAVVISGLVLIKTGWNWLDPVVSLVVSAVILAGTWGLLRDALDLSMDAVPKHVDPDAVRSYLCSLEGVETIHDLHVWSMSTTEVALTAHLVMAWPSQPPSFLTTLCDELKKRFAIHHVTVQLEPNVGECSQAAEGAV
jgi:cobalt-zinc-cadmium efflux system protein